MSSAKPVSSEETILVVDDEVLLRTAIAEYLRDCGYRVLEAASAAEAITVLQDAEFHVDVVLSAVEMRGPMVRPSDPMDGFALSRWAREHRPDIEVVLAGTTARAAASAAELCDKGPMLSRPYEPQLVLDRIKRMLAERKPR